MFKKFIISQILKRTKKEDLFRWFVETNVLPSIEPSLSKANKKMKMKMIQAKMEKPKNGGVFIHFSGRKYLFPGFPNKKIVWQTAKAKRLIPVAINWMHDFIKQSIPNNPKLYCKSVREIYRLFNIVIERNTDLRLKEKFIKEHGQRKSDSMIK